MRGCIVSVCVELGDRQKAGDCIQELIGVVQGPEVDVQCVKAKEAMPLIARLCVWQPPFVLGFVLGFVLLVGILHSIYGQTAMSWELSRVPDVDIVQGAVERILIWGPWVVGDLDARFVLRDIVVDV